jgi:hypothetical protein
MLIVFSSVIQKYASRLEAAIRDEDRNISAEVRSRTRFTISSYLSIGP